MNDLLPLIKLSGALLLLATLGMAVRSAKRHFAISSEGVSHLSPEAFDFWMRREQRKG